MEFEATIEYPTSEHVNKSAITVANISVKTNITNLNTPVTSDTVENEDNHLLENNLDLDQSNSVNSETGASNLKKCIIKLTDLSAEEQNKWLGLTDKSSASNLSTDSNSSRYYMRARVNTVRNNKRPGWKTTKPVNYHESPPSRELNDSDYEPAAKCEKPLETNDTPVTLALQCKKS